MESSFLSVERPGLFRSKAWLLAWLEVWGDHPNIQLCNPPLGFDEEKLNKHKLSSSIFKINEILFAVFSITSAHPLGLPSRFTSSIRSEYFQFDIDPDKDISVCTNYLNKTLNAKWDRLIFSDVLADSSDYKGIVAAARLKNLSVVKSAKENTYGINLQTGKFTDYVKARGKNTRLKLFNSRKKLEQYGEVTVENIWPDRTRFFDLLNVFHALRWGKPCYRGRNEIFINKLLDELPKIGAKIDFSVMTINAIPVSVAFDIYLNGRIYNLQSGYSEDFAKGVALGTLHLGYQIEAAFANKEAVYYDLMAGRGKNSNYKKSLSNSYAEFVTLTLVRNPFLSFVYKVHARIKRIIYSLAELDVISMADLCG